MYSLKLRALQYTKSTYTPTRRPTYTLTSRPTYTPTRRPTYTPTRRPTFTPTLRPTQEMLKHLGTVIVRDRILKAFANSLVPDETPQNEADEGIVEFEKSQVYVRLLLSRHDYVT
ncbi:hypothetical protein DPMN_128499, partial [Dreissena polymorpha]